jgi:hypothetical protein
MGILQKNSPNHPCRPTGVISYNQGKIIFRLILNRVGPKKNVRGAFFAVRNVLLLKSIIQWSDNESRDNGKHIWGIDHTGKDSNRKFNV